MWTLFTIAAMALALAALRFTLFSSTKSWDVMNYLGTYLLIWLPLVSIVALALLYGIAVRGGWRWTAVASIGVILGAVQFAFIALTNSSRLANSFLPAVLLALSVLALLRVAK